MRDGNTALHLCAQLNLTECMKLLLRLRQDLVDVENYEGQMAFDIAKDRHYDVCVELVSGPLGVKVFVVFCVLSLKKADSLLLIVISRGLRRYFLFENML